MKHKKANRIKIFDHMTIGYPSFNTMLVKHFKYLHFIDITILIASFCTIITWETPINKRLVQSSIDFNLPYQTQSWLYQNTIYWDTNIAIKYSYVSLTCQFLIYFDKYIQRSLNVEMSSHLVINFRLNAEAALFDSSVSELQILLTAINDNF